MKITKIIYREFLSIQYVSMCVFVSNVSCKSVCVCICVYCLCYVYLSLTDMCDCVHAFIYSYICNCTLLCVMWQGLLSLQYKGADATR